MPSLGPTEVLLLVVPVAVVVLLILGIADHMRDRRHND